MPRCAIHAAQGNTKTILHPQTALFALQGNIQQCKQVLSVRIAQQARGMTELGWALHAPTNVGKGLPASEVETRPLTVCVKLDFGCKTDHAWAAILAVTKHSIQNRNAQPVYLANTPWKNGQLRARFVHQELG